MNHSERYSELHNWLIQGAIFEVESWLSQLTQFDAEAYYLQGRYFEKKQSWDDAWEAYQAGLDLDSTHAALHDAVGMLALRLNAFEAAQYHLEAARAFLPENQLFTRNLVTLYLVLGERHQALIYVKALLELSPDASSYALFARVMYLFGQREVAQLAMQESLVQDLKQDDRYLWLIWWALQDGRWGEALQFVLKHQAAPCEHYDREQLALALHLYAYVFAVQGDLAQAREYWENALALHFQPSTMWAYTFSLPFVYESIDQRSLWHGVLEQGLSLLRTQEVLPDAYLWLLWPFSPVPETSQVELNRLWQKSLKRPVQTEQQAYVGSPKTSVFWVVSDLMNLETQESLLALLQYGECHDWQILYFFPGALPDCFLPWSTRFLQAPVHPLALGNWVRGLNPLALCYLQCEREWVAFASEGIAFQAKSSSLKGLEGLPFDMTFEPVVAPVEVVAAKREGFDLPRLGQLYFCPAEPHLWQVEWDEWIAALLQADRKAFILGLQRSGSSLHTHVQQRLEERLGERSHRIRWLDLNGMQQRELVTVADVVLQPEGLISKHLCLQALRSGVAVVSLASTGAINEWLIQMGLSEWILTSRIEDVRRLVRTLNQRTDRAILRESLAQAYQKLDYSVEVLALEQHLHAAISQKMDHDYEP